MVSLGQGNWGDWQAQIDLLLKPRDPFLDVPIQTQKYLSKVVIHYLSEGSNYVNV